MSVSSALRLSKDSARFTAEDVKRIVANCPKQRFALRDDPATGELQIRANQGHSMEVGVAKGRGLRTHYLCRWMTWS